jgi:hypothetical protein
MTRLILALAASIALSACGSSNGSESAAQRLPSPAANEVLFSVQGEITAVRILASEAGSFHSVAEVNYMLNCTERIESFVSSVKEHNGVFTVYASALASDSRSQSGLHCLGMVHVTKEVVLASGAIGIEQVRLVDLKMLSTRVPYRGATEGLKRLSDLTVISAEPIITGTLVTIQGFRPCDQKEGPYAYAVDSTKDNTVTLAVASFAIATVTTQPIAGCLGIVPQLVRITLPNEHVTKDEITLEIL